MDACIWIAPTWRVVWRRSIARVAQLPQPRLDDLERLRAAKTTGAKADLSERRRARILPESPPLRAPEDSRSTNSAQGEG